MVKILEYLNEDNEIIETDENDRITSDFGITQVGSNPGKKFKYKIRNTLPNMIELIPYSEDADLHVTVEPKMLDAGAPGIMEVIFSPPENRTTPLRGKWGADVIIG